MRAFTVTPEIFTQRLDHLEKAYPQAFIAMCLVAHEKDPLAKGIAAEEEIEQQIAEGKKLITQAFLANPEVEDVYGKAQPLNEFIADVHQKIDDLFETE